LQKGFDPAVIRQAHGPSPKLHNGIASAREEYLQSVLNSSRLIIMEISKAELASAAAASGAAPSSSSHPEIRGAEVLCEALAMEGVKYIWGYPGGAVLHIYDAVYKQQSMQHILVRHEHAPQAMWALRW
jgi:hypothetical protein